MKDGSWQAARDALAIEGDALEQIGARLSRDAFEQAVDLLLRAPRVATCGCGHSGIACMHLSHLMCCIGKAARFLSPAEGLHGGLGFLQPGDALALLSRGGKTDELLLMQNAAMARGIDTLVVTEDLTSPLALSASVTLPMTVTRECDRDNCQGTTSFIVSCALFDAIQSAMIEETDFSSAQFASLHPGGAVGKRLNSSANEQKG